MQYSDKIPDFPKENRIIYDWLSFTTPDAGTTYPQLWNRNAAVGTWPNPSYETEKNEIQFQF